MVSDSFRTLGFSEEEAEQLDRLSEIGCINALSPEEVTAAFQKAVSGINKAMPCESCTHYPPSACDGKPCCVCDPDNPYLNCYEEKECRLVEMTDMEERVYLMDDRELAETILYCFADKADDENYDCQDCPLDCSLSNPSDPTECLDYLMEEAAKRLLKYAEGAGGK